jgi:ribosome-binding factor A
MSKHDDRALSQVAHEAANWIVREATGQSLITVTRAELSHRGERMTIFVSVFPIEQARPALAFLSRSRGDFSQYLRQHLRLSPMPAIDFALEPELGTPLPEAAPE